MNVRSNHLIDYSAKCGCEEEDVAVPTKNDRRRSRNVLTLAEVDARNPELQRTTAGRVPAGAREKVKCEEPCSFRRCGKQLTDRRNRRLNPEQANNPRQVLQQ
jgi:hypothetical protein